MRAHWISLLLGLGLLMGALSFHAYATSLPDEPIRATITGEPVVDGTAALVFHGGPHPRWTSRVLDKLAARDMKATFFVVGAQVNEHPELVRRMVAEGHEVGVSGFRSGETTRLGTAFAQNALADTVNVHTGLSEPEPDTPDLHRYDAKQIAADLDPDRVIRLHVTSTTPGVIDLLADALPDRRFTTLTTATGRGAAMSDAWFGARVTGYAQSWSQRHGDVVATILGIICAVVAVFALLRTVMQLGLAHTSRRLHREIEVRPHAPPVSVIVPAYNEAANIAAAVRSIVNSEHPADVEVVVVDDGSTDGTAQVVEALNLPGVRVVSQSNLGKFAALNAGIALARHDALVLVDGDTVFEPDTVSKVVRPLGDTGVGAVSGNVKVANRGGLLGRWQHLEYCAGSNLDRQILNALECIPTIPGAIGAFRRDAVDEVGGISPDTLAEDTDLTMAITRAGWRVVYEPAARAWTEVPTSARGLYKQRYRWSYGTFQSMWKHRPALREEGRMGRFGLLYLLVFHVVLPVLAPALDVYVLYGAFVADAPWALVIWAAFLAVQTASAGYALRLDGESLKPLWAFPLQQLAYRQLTYLVVVQSLVTALHGTPLKWQTARRSGLAEVATG
ncbi:family 2 glycosyl transferase [Saccharothrix sp. ALI-22-I]|uniref:glycosyltransferase n=1 Tax=Saccharothrix sp. ALI-22-I TaxID=1933778 RepID=UPI00097C90D0|nr:glycosyltransferase [Saccharothrix sp. ALI-22-I]ONI87329.1 family 2 glycosyl transferase [Saccharothrix sp. ALI-22-I]